MSRYSRQRIGDNPPDNNRQATPQAHHKHISISSAGTGPLLSSGTRSEQVHLHNLFLHGEHFANQGMGQGPRTLAHRVCHSCEYRERETTEQVIIVIVIETVRRERELTRERERKKESESKREKKFYKWRVERGEWRVERGERREERGE